MNVRSSPTVSILTFAFLAIAAICLILAPILRKRGEAGRRLMTSAEFDAAYEKNAHTSRWVYAPLALRLHRASYICVFLAWLALVGVYFSIRG